MLIWFIEIFINMIYRNKLYVFTFILKKFYYLKYRNFLQLFQTFKFKNLKYPGIIFVFNLLIIFID